MASNSIDNRQLQTLMSRLALRPPFLDTNSFLSHSLDDFLLQFQSLNPDNDDPTTDDDDDDGGDLPSTPESRKRGLISREESKLEKEIIRIILSGGGVEALKPNSGHSVAIGDHNVCVGSHDEPGSGFRVWEWHGHIAFFDEEDGYSAEYIYGHYFEWITEKKKKGRDERDSGLKDLVGDSSKEEGRVVHRNFLRAGSAAAR